ncbi:uncharacterized protein [Oscarella lobularis]|uniref:uncharacterized protein n=1 Tax=Oscarella lobularis TaxID=121494 RepID=UPI003313E93C
MWRTMWRTCAGILLLFIAITVASDRDGDGPNTFVFDGAELLALKQRIVEARMRGDERESYHWLLRKAEKAMKRGPFSVMKKPSPPPSGNMHDYESLASFYWPCNNATLTPGPKCNLTTGLPWVGVDGHHNPYGDRFDRVPMDKMIEAVQILGAAYFFSEKEKYGERAALLLRTWFLYSATWMRPNLNFSSIRMGHNNGSSSGVIDIHDMYIVVEVASLIVGSKVWTDEDHRELMKWFYEMVHWLVESPFGQAANLKPNNHGTWSDVIRSSFALFSDDKVVANETAQGAISKRIKTQIEPDGRMPYEESRADAASYSCMNIRALFNLARLSSFSGVDLFNYTSEDGRGIRKAFEYLIPFALGEKPWPYRETNKKFSWGQMYSIFRRAANAYQDRRYEEMIRQLPSLESDDDNENGFGLPDDYSSYLTNLLFPKQFY